MAYVDVDGTLAPTLGDKKDGMEMSYKGVWGYHPWSSTGEVLYLVNRPGNVVSHEGAAEWIGKAIGLVAPHVERVCVRGDTDFSLTATSVHLRLRLATGHGQAGQGSGGG